MAGDAPGSQEPRTMPELLELLGWKREVAELYRRLREAPASEPAWHTWRDGRDSLFRSHPSSPVPVEQRGMFTGLPYFPYDPQARVTAVLSAAPAERVQIGGSHGTFDALRFATAGFELHGALLRLDLYWLEGYGGGLFVPFHDLTSGSSTYGAGRYLLDTVKGADLGSEPGGLVLDFNFAYHPSCVYDPRWACPLAPPANHLPAAVEAGERLPEP